MKNAVDDPSGEEGTNVIEVSFQQKSPVSNYTEDLDYEIDPIEDLLSDLDDDYFEDVDKKEDFIFHHQNNWDYSLSMKDSSTEMADTLLKQTERLTEDIKRLKYYLDEMNID